jgi:chemotaxis protein CheD
VHRKLDWPAGYQTQLVTVVQGKFQISADPNVVFSTILGSCVSACLFDEVAKIGGMNHYLLADCPSNSTSSLRYGVHAMELLINALQKAGASRSRLKAKVFGGGTMSGLFHDIGQKNGEFVLNYLSEEGVPVSAQDLGGTSARRINFHPITGQVRCATTKDTPEKIRIILRSPQNPKILF